MYPKTPSNQSQVDDQCLELASKEFDSPTRKEGLWARCFAESGGQENRAKAKYLEVRFQELRKISSTLLF